MVADNSPFFAFCISLCLFCATSFVSTIPPQKCRHKASSLFMGKTMFDKIWEQHMVDSSNGNSLIYIDRHLVHEVTSPQVHSTKRGPRRRILTIFFSTFYSLSPLLTILTLLTRLLKVFVQQAVRFVVQIVHLSL